MIPTSESPIGIFDSGVGGLTVMRSLAELLPEESFVYFGDTAHLPYGDKTPQQVAEFSYKSLSFLEEKNVKLLVVACHTSCTTSFSFLQNAFKIPVIGITDAAFQCIDRIENKRHIAILGTQTTINSETYQKRLHNLYPSLTVTAVGCPLFVPLIEKGFLHNHPLITSQTVKDQIKPLQRAAAKNPLDAIMLACTHYPLLQNLIQQEVGLSVPIIDPSSICAELVQNFLEKNGLRNQTSRKPTHTFYVSGCFKKFRDLGSYFLPSIVDSVVLPNDFFLKEKA